MAAADRVTVVDPSDYTKIVGQTFAKQEHFPLVVIGARSWNKWQLGRIGCPHPSAAIKVNRLIQAEGIKSPAEFIARARDFGQYKGLGVTCYWTVLALVRDLGADIDEVHGEDRSFHAVHTAALKRDEGVTKLRGQKKRWRGRAVSKVG